MRGADMMFLGRLFYAPLSDDEFSHVTSSPDIMELFTDFVAVLQGLVVPLSDRSYSRPVFSVEVADSTCEQMVADFEKTG